MSPKFFIYAGMLVGSYVGGALPLLWGVGGFSFQSILLGMVGGILGIWLGFKISKSV